jgi:hypothetical protein
MVTMRRFQIACLLGLTTGMVLAACGGATKNDTQFSSGLPPGKGLAGLSPSDENQLCNSVTGFVRDHGAAFCKFSGLLSASVDVSFDPSVTDESIQRACTDTVTGCERTLTNGLSSASAMCRQNAFASCNATVGEYEACLSEEIDTLNETVAAGPDCSSLTVSYLRPRSSDMVTTDKVVLTNGPACKKFKAHCPEAFSSDSSGGSTVTPGDTSSMGPSDFVDAGATSFPTPTCGNGVIESGEQCDSTAPIGQTCLTVTMGAFPAGTLRCSSSCTLDVSGCMQPP